MTTVCSQPERAERPAKSVPAPASPPAAPAKAVPATKPKPASAKPDPQLPKLWNVVLLDDQDHTYEYVIRMMQTIFGMGQDAALKVAETVDREGRAICMTTHKELAELKQEQVLSFGIDAMMPQCKGSMSAVIEPVG